MIVVFFGSFIDTLLFEAARRRDVNLTADDRLDTVAHRLAIKLDSAEHVAVVGHGHGRLFERFDALEQLIDLVGAVQKTVFGMAVKMNETGMFHRAKSQLAQSQWRDNYFAAISRKELSTGWDHRPEPTKSVKIVARILANLNSHRSSLPMDAIRCPS